MMLVSIVRKMRLKTQANRWHLMPKKKHTTRTNIIPCKSGSWRSHKRRHPDMTLLEGIFLALVKFPSDGNFGSRNSENPVNLSVPFLHSKPFVGNKLIFDASLRVNFRKEIKLMADLHIFDDDGSQEPRCVVTDARIIVPDPQIGEISKRF